MQKTLKISLSGGIVDMYAKGTEANPIEMSDEHSMPISLRARALLANTLPMCAQIV